MACGLAEAGADLVICGRRRPPLAETAQEAGVHGVDVAVLPADVTDEASASALKQGAGKVDILVNNAGISPIHPWETVSMEQWRAIFSLNVDAPFRLCQLFAPAMIERGWGRIINISSVYGSLGGNVDRYPGIDWDLPAYFASKHGLNGLTRYFATRLAPHGICVNSISPGMFRTPLSESKLTPEVARQLEEATPMKRLGGSEDLKAAVVFLASPGAAFVTGQILLIDGGYSVW
jgi:gluconate 5-dehydrogenase